MHNTYVTSSYTLRTRWSVPYSSTDCTICSNERHPFAYSSSTTACCCSCCASSMYRAPISPSYCYNLYGYGQSSLIQRSPCRNVCLGGFDRCYYQRAPVCAVNRRCFVDKGCNFREKSVGGKRGRLRKVMVFEERDDSDDLGDVDEAEILLSLLSDDVDEECVYVKRDRKRLVKKPIVEKRENGEECVYVKRDSNRLVKKPVVEKRENNGSCSECGSRKKIVDLGVLENDVSREYKSVVPSSRKGSDRRRVEIIQKEDEGQASLRKENRKTRINEEKREANLRKVNQRAEEKQEQETLLRKENWEARARARAREEEREKLSRREEHRPKVARAESSCSSYYSVSSTGDYASDNDIEHRDERYAGESSSGYKDNTRRNEIVYQEARKEDQRHEGYRVDHQVGLTKKSTAQESRISSSVTESDFRKKSEKKLTDVSIEEIESRKGNMQKESELSMTHGSGYGKSSSSYMKFDDRKLKSTGSAHLDVAKQLHRQTGEEVSRQSETKMKYKQLAEVTDDDRRDAKTSYGSKRMYSGKDDMSATVISSSQEAATEHLTSVGLTTRDDEYHKNSQKVSQVSNIVDIDVRNTSISQKKIESSDKKKEDYSTNVLSSVYDAKRQQHHDKVSVQSQQLTKKGSTSTSKRESDRKLGKQEENVNLVYGSSHYDQVGGQSQQLTKEEGTSFSKRQSERNLVKQEENVNLVYGSSQGLEERHSQSHANYIRTEDSRNESNKLTSISISHSGHSSAIVVDEQNKTNSATLVRPPYSHLGASGAQHDESNRGSSMENVTDESLQFGSSKLHDRHLERSTAMHHEEYGRVQSDAGDLMFKAHEDALESAARFQKSSAHYVGEFVDQVRHETMSSEIQKEKKTYETKLVHEEKNDQKRLSQYSSGESSSKDHDIRHASQGSEIKGPSDEEWKIDEPLVQEPSESELQEDGKNTSNVIVKRTGRSLWNVIADVFRLPWSPQSERHSASGKTGGRSSRNQSTSSETWFSGHEAEEIKETNEEKQKISIFQEQKTHSQFKESSSSSTSEGYLEHIGPNAPSSSVVLECGVASIEEPSRSDLAGTSNAASIVAQSSISMPALRLQRSPIVRSNLETGEENLSGSSTGEQLNNDSMEQSELVITHGEQKGRKLQRKDQMVKDKFDEWEEAYRLEAEQRKLDEMFMREALLEARKAAECWEVPVGAVLVHKGKIIARGWNLVEEMRDSTAHAEMICIREASKILRTWRLSETTLYVTLEPCPMCAGAILQARIDCVVWGAPNKLLGADGSWIRLFPRGDGGNVLEQNDKPAAPVHPFHPKIAIRRNVLASECADAMQQFFQLRRKKKDKKPSPPSPPSCLPIPHHQPKFLTKMQGAFHIMFHS